MKTDHSQAALLKPFPTTVTSSHRRAHSRAIRMTGFVVCFLSGWLRISAAEELFNLSPAMLSGPLNFFASPPGLTIADPIPYGIQNNLADRGWIWPNDNSGLLQVDFGGPQVVNLFRVYSTYPGGGRGAVWAIERSDDEADWTPVADFTFETQAGAGSNEDRCNRTDFGGWYGITFNDNNAAARFWRIRQDHVTVNHAPRCGQVQFYQIPHQVVLVLTVGRQGTQVGLSWADPTDTAVLQSADTITGVWTDVPGAFSPHLIDPSSTHRFFRLRK